MLTSCLSKVILIRLIHFKLDYIINKTVMRITYRVSGKKYFF